MLTGNKWVNITSLWQPVELECAWCGSRVPLPAGDFCGVCIDCGTVIFRQPVDSERETRSDRGNERRHAGAPSV